MNNTIIYISIALNIGYWIGVLSQMIMTKVFEEQDTKNGRYFVNGKYVPMDAANKAMLQNTINATLKYSEPLALKQPSEDEVREMHRFIYANIGLRGLPSDAHTKALIDQAWAEQWGKPWIIEDPPKPEPPEPSRPDGWSEADVQKWFEEHPGETLRFANKPANHLNPGKGRRAADASKPQAQSEPSHWDGIAKIADQHGAVPEIGRDDL